VRKVKATCFFIVTMKTGVCVCVSSFQYRLIIERIKSSTKCLINFLTRLYYFIVNYLRFFISTANPTPFSLTGTCMVKMNGKNVKACQTAVPKGKCAVKTL